MTQLTALAEKVEGAEGASRELDLEVFRAIGAPVPFEFLGLMVALVFDEAAKAYFADIRGMRVRYEPPAYSASLDAAMGLVPQGWGWNVSQPNEKAIASGLLKKKAPVRGEVQYGCGQMFTVAAATPALALTAAALRAQAALSSNKSEK